MRFKTPQGGDTRIKIKFAILPIRLYNDIRWLEKVKIRQVYRYYNGWTNDCFID